MKITSIIIDNYKSIKKPIIFDIKAISDKRCFILLGINESGKSNILKGIFLMDNSAKCNYGLDCNSDREGDKIALLYQLTPDSSDNFTKFFEAIGLDGNLLKEITVENLEAILEIDQDNARHNSYSIHIKDKKNVFSKYVITDNKILPKDEDNIKKNESGQPLNILDKEKLEDFLSKSVLTDIIKQNIPKIIFWNPSDPKYLITDNIDLNQFKDNVDNSIPLKNIFRIANIEREKIKGTIDAIVGNSAKIGKLEDRLGKNITGYINQRWKEHNIGIRIRIDNMQLSFLVEDKDADDSKYGVNQRSDGFKHFVSILLNLSIENKTDQLKNTIILLDEPEIHLHPSGEKYLLAELLKIAENNIIFFATHSIYMVDKKNIDRHVSVEKENGITKVTNIDKDNPYKEEVLYEALGTSILEHVSNNVLIVEGKIDRDILDLYIRKFKSEFKPANITIISADGCNNIIKYTKFFNTKLINGYVLVDSDECGKNEKIKILEQKNYSRKNVFELNDIIETKCESTVEDLFDKKYLTGAVKEKFSIDIDLNQNKPMISQIEKKFHDSRIRFKDSEKEDLKKCFFKQILKLKKDELKTEKYFQFSKNLLKKISL